MTWAESDIHDKLLALERESRKRTDDFLTLEPETPESEKASAPPPLATVHLYRNLRRAVDAFDKRLKSLREGDESVNSPIMDRVRAAWAEEMSGLLDD